MKNLYKAFLNIDKNPKAIAIFNQHGVQPPVLIDEYEGQYYNPEASELIGCRFIFIEYDIDYKKSTAEPATIILNLHLGYEQVKRANNTTVNLDAHLKHFDYTEAVKEVVKTITSKNTGTLNLISENSLKEPAITKVHILTYEASYSQQKIKELETVSTPNATLSFESEIRAFKNALE